MATLKQARYIAEFIRHNNGDYPTLETIWKAVAKDNPSIYNLEAVKTLEGHLQRLSVSEASYIISWMLGKKDRYGREYRTSNAFTYLVNLKIV